MNSTTEHAARIVIADFTTKNFLFTSDAGIPALTQAVDLLEHNNFDFTSLDFTKCTCIRSNSRKNNYKLS